MDRLDLEIDEYLWPLTGALWAVDWQLLAEELQVRQRLAEIMTHVHAMHLDPRVRRLGTRASAADVSAVCQSIVSGPDDGPPWTQTLHAPIPRALREEWERLGQRLQEIARDRGRQLAVRPTGHRG